jgi:exosortase K
MKKCRGKEKTRATILLENALFHATGLILVLSLKGYYSRANADGLRWILTPVAGIASFLTGVPFDWLPLSGYVNHLHGVVIAPACAGVNFLIICFGALFFTFVSRFKGQPAKCLWFFTSAVAAFLVTLVANSLRIILSIQLYDAPIYAGWLTPERVHQLTGIVIFVSLLVLTWLAAERTVRQLSPAERAVSKPKPDRIAGMPVATLFLLVPFFWYALITVIVPLFNGAAEQYGPDFMEHSLMVMLASGCIFLITLWATQGRKKLTGRIERKNLLSEANSKTYLTRRRNDATFF